MRLAKGQQIAGRSAVEVRHLLRRGSAGNVGAEWTDAFAASLLKISGEEAAALHDELARLGFIEKARRGKRYWQATATGSALCMASAAAPIKRARADEMVLGLIERVRDVNRNQTYLFWVTRLALFGSYLSDSPDVGDIDALFELTPRIADQEELSRRRNEYASKAAQAGRRFSNIVDYLCWPETEIKQILRARQRISLHEWREAEGLRKLGAVIREIPLDDDPPAKRRRGRSSERT